jgi:hypothetical protein
MTFLYSYIKQDGKESLPWKRSQLIASSIVCSLALARACPLRISLPHPPLPFSQRSASMLRRWCALATCSIPQLNYLNSVPFLLDRMRRNNFMLVIGGVELEGWINEDVIGFWHTTYSCITNRCLKPTTVEKTMDASTFYDRLEERKKQGLAGSIRLDSAGQPCIYMNSCLTMMLETSLLHWLEIV